MSNHTTRHGWSGGAPHDYRRSKSRPWAGFGQEKNAAIGGRNKAGLELAAFGKTGGSSLHFKRLHVFDQRVS